MRFFLYKYPTQPASRLWSELTRPTPKKIDLSKVEMTLWGQQCSSTCGCVVRFDVKADSLHRIIDISFSSKAVVAKSLKKNSEIYLQPVMTTRHNQPLLKTCKCSTLETLASQAIFAIKQKLPLSISSAQNMLESAGIRSSKAMRTVALQNFDCSPNDTHCYDIVEEALTACLKGHMPLPRFKRRTKLRKFEDGGKRSESEINQDQLVHSHELLQTNKRTGNVFPPNKAECDFPSAMPAFHMQNEPLENGVVKLEKPR